MYPPCFFWARAEKRPKKLQLELTFLQIQGVSNLGLRYSPPSRRLDGCGFFWTLTAGQILLPVLCDWRGNGKNQKVFFFPSDVYSAPLPVCSSMLTCIPKADLYFQNTGQVFIWLNHTDSLASIQIWKHPTGHCPGTHFPSIRIFNGKAM